MGQGHRMTQRIQFPAPRRQQSIERRGGSICEACLNGKHELCDRCACVCTEIRIELHQQAAELQKVAS